MKKALLILVGFCFLGLNAHAQEDESKYEKQCRKLAKEQKVAVEEVEDFIDGCIQDLIDQEMVEGQDAGPDAGNPSKD
ncbi:MAG: hypothetical protein A2600_01340 [Candidatus Lambdaproteobacteria bacterium RIFOXYD1_FULL_56_27]|uniref:Uncharacterized protein n=1 Tax=Candidatus Lambdaproteobacteria bacterium RIFOXYD2_FULL_56_26 TaxID=1817773 RepID=A0A1F6GSE8_9PROT|nr:MAG: hypothetical protein A2557_00455 [Candidatus Lambdaproteobacteria bacterium RIFOXYD2_FULL_56_26]OGH01378.1 MAG: hypothetical protein A2426_13290 [Candidatus Lambdaproteobacteria bacterium RIFOXYC1_FULL_56_13]OGH06919.1 MAG: hypothetical protein A2600_01340 [Candidatus Lambdaproteobacteria bacterium RIFOXYD1_FULL_56_27]